MVCRVVGSAGIEMVTRETARPIERMVSRRDQLTLVPIAENREACDRRRKVSRAANDDLEIDDRLGREPRDRGAPDVVDVERKVAEARHERCPQLGETGRPGRVIFDEHDRIHDFDRHAHVRRRMWDSNLNPALAGICARHRSPTSHA